MPGPSAGLPSLNDKGKPTPYRDADHVRRAHGRCQSKGNCTGPGCRLRRGKAQHHDEGDSE